jgi:hypothetical protein
MAQRDTPIPPARLSRLAAVVTDYMHLGGTGSGHRSLQRPEAAKDAALPAPRPRKAASAKLARPIAVSATSNRRGLIDRIVPAMASLWRRIL